MPHSTISSPSSEEQPATQVQAPPVNVRPMETLAELRTCVALQQEIWGAEFDEIVPASLMLAAHHVDALALGAYGPDETLVGFVFGLTGLKDGEVAHWSHMLGVKPGARDQGIGRRLKEVQREILSCRGIKRMYWTFDPLQARNAHLNINRLGVRVVEYVTDMYGTSQSPLHHAVGTDRLVVECLTDGNGHEAAPRANGHTARGHVLTAFPREEPPAAGQKPVLALIEIPWDLQAVVADSARIANEWRSATRGYFQWALANGYRVTGVRRDAEARRVFFVLERVQSTDG
ncbi:MAG: GNAT family N-acetyltransferase [Longimicrobiales bacterium]